MNVQEALDAAQDAYDEKLLGKYPMALQVLAQELNHLIAKNAVLIPEVQLAQDKCRELKRCLDEAENKLTKYMRDNSTICYQCANASQKK